MHTHTQKWKEASGSLRGADAQRGPPLIFNMNHTCEAQIRRTGQNARRPTETHTLPPHNVPLHPGENDSLERLGFLQSHKRAWNGLKAKSRCLALAGAKTRAHLSGSLELSILEKKTAPKCFSHGDSQLLFRKLTLFMPESPTYIWCPHCWLCVWSLKGDSRLPLEE